MSLEALLDLQLVDSAIDQLRHRRGRLPEVAAQRAAAAAIAAWNKQRNDALARLGAFEAEIGRCEQENHKISTQRSRLEGQLKTVIAVREAEALMHEISGLTQRRGELDDLELAAMEEMADAEADIAELDAAEAGLTAQRATADADAGIALGTVDAELADLADRSLAARASLDPKLVSLYDSMRSNHDGVAIAKLDGLRCQGCHLDLSRGEVDRLKVQAPDDFPECPNCGRLLVL